MSIYWTEERVYFNYDPSGAIQSATIANGKVISQETFQQDLCLRKWADALCEMEETRKMSWSDASTPTWKPNIEGNEEWTPGQNIFNNFMTEYPQPQVSAWFGSDQVEGGDILHEFISQGAENNPINTRPLSSHLTSLTPITTGRLMNEIEIDSTLSNHTETLACSPMPQTPIRSNRFKKPDLEAKRMVKLSRFLEALRNHPSSSLQDHNQKVNALYDRPRLPNSEVNVSMMQFAGVLSQVGDVSTTMGFIYTLLSWEIFRREELRLVYREKMAGNLAAKQVNQQMADLLKRRCKAKDWASDGRRAAEMVFRAMRNVSFAVSSCALILLGDVSSLDCMLKIAHFPILRQRFEENFANFVHSQAPKWEARSLQGYQMFDFEEFLRQRGRPPNRENLPTPLTSQNLELDRSVLKTNDRLNGRCQMVEASLPGPMLESHWEITCSSWPFDTNHADDLNNF